jgi:hypothetical protein
MCFTLAKKMKRVTKSCSLVLCAFVLSAIPAQSIPMPKTEKSTIHGTIVDWVWRNKIEYQQESRGLTFERTIPNHYMIRLKIKEKRNALLNAINSYSMTIPISNCNISDDMAEDEVIIYLPSPRLKGIKDDAKITIVDYSIFTHDFGAEAESANILINGESLKFSVRSLIHKILLTSRTIQPLGAVLFT